MCLAVIPSNTPPTTPQYASGCHFLSDCSCEPICWCGVLSPWDTCIDQFNTRPPTWETSLWSNIFSLAQLRTDKYQREQRTCLSYPLRLQWTQHALVPPNWFFCSNPCPWLPQAPAEGGFVWIGMIMAIGSPKHWLQPRWMTSPPLVPYTHEWRPAPSVPTILPQPWQKWVRCRGLALWDSVDG